MDGLAPTSFAVLGAFFGGIILNLMPCVFPMLAIKVLAVARQAGASAGSLRAAGFAYTAGVVVSFLVLLAVLLALRASGEHVGWGFQLQQPAFVASLLVLFVLMSLALSGLLEVSLPAGWLPTSLTAKQGLAGEFFAGLLAVFLASPCTAPLMAPALGFALSQKTSVAALVFLSLSLGFAFPFLFLSCWPRAARMLPKPGPWMQTLRQMLVFPLIATQIWLLWLFTKAAGADAAAWLLTGVLSGVFALWALTKQKVGWKFRASGGVVGLAMLVFVALAARPKPMAVVWQTWSSESVQMHLSQGKTVFVDFTADWCVTCKINEKTVFDSRRMRDYLAGEGKHVTLLKADWTNEDEVITKELERFGRAGVPLYLVYHQAGVEPQVLPQILTPELVLDALKKEVSQVP